MNNNKERDFFILPIPSIVVIALSTYLIIFSAEVLSEMKIKAPIFALLIIPGLLLGLIQSKILFQYTSKSFLIWFTVTTVSVTSGFTIIFFLDRYISSVNTLKYLFLVPHHVVIAVLKSIVIGSIMGSIVGFIVGAAQGFLVYRKVKFIHWLFTSVLYWIAGLSIPLIIIYIAISSWY